MAYNVGKAETQPGGAMMGWEASEHTGGDVWWVNNTGGTDGTGNGKTPQLPFDTISYAESQAEAGDAIYVMPGHTETLTGTLTVNIANVKIIGLGGRTRRPQLLLDAAAAHIAISGAGVTLENMTLSAGYADVVKAINITGAGVTIRNCSFRENVAEENFLIGILTSNAADDLVVEDCEMITVDASATEGIEIVGACDRIVLRNNYFNGPWSVAAVSATTAACLDAQIIGNRIVNSLADDNQEGTIDMVASSTGFLAHNRMHLADNTDILTMFDSANMARCDNLVSNEFAEEGTWQARSA